MIFTGLFVRSLCRLIGTRYAMSQHRMQLCGERPPADMDSRIFAGA